MQTASYPSQAKTQICVRELFPILLPDEQFKSIHDLFNAQKFHKLLAALVHGMDEEFRHKLPELKLFEDSQSQSYNDMRRKQFKAISQNIQHVEQILGIPQKRLITDKDINKMVQRSSMRALHKFLQHTFEMLQFNKALLHEITGLDEDVQQTFFEVMQTYSNLTEESEFQDSDSEISSLKISSKINRSELDQNQIAHLQQFQNELQSHIELKEEEIKELKFCKEQLEDDLDELRRQMSAKHQEIEILKKRIMSYEQIDQLMIEKDEQILKLTKKLADHELKSRLKQSQLTNENRHLQERLSQIQSKDFQIATKYEKQKQNIQLFNKQREESEASMKKVIHNLKQKNKSFMDKINDLQKELIEANFEKQMKDKQLYQLKNSLTQSRKPLSATVLDNLQSPRSPLKQDFNEQLGSVRGNYSKLGEQLSIDLDRADFEDQFGPLPKENNKRFNELLQENYMLKQQLYKIQSSSSLDSKQCKDLQDEVQKMKKKINILKRRNDEIENQRKEEIDVMVGIMELYSSSIGGNGKN